MHQAVDLMTPEPICVGADAPAAVCADLMTRHDIRHLPVVAHGRLVGLVTDWWLYQRGAITAANGWAPFDAEDGALTAADLARPVEVVVHRSERLEPVLRALSHAFQDVAVVTDAAGRPTGILTEHDALRLAAERIEDDAWSTELTSHRVATVGRDAPTRRCLAILVRQPGRHLLVTEEQALVGVLSYGDLARDARAARRCAGDLLQNVPPEYAVGAVPLRYAAQVMLTQRIGCLPVVDRELRPLRILGRGDILRVLLETLEREESRLRQAAVLVAT